MMRQSGFVLLAFSFFDAATGEYSLPSFARTVDEAVRKFELLLSKEEVVESVFGGRPGDYRLFLVGSFETDIGVLKAVDGGPVLIEQALELVKALPASKVVPNPEGDLQRSAFMKRIDIADRMSKEA